MMNYRGGIVGLDHGGDRADFMNKFLHILVQTLAFSLTLVVKWIASQLEGAGWDWLQLPVSHSGRTLSLCQRLSEQTNFIAH